MIWYVIKSYTKSKRTSPKFTEWILGQGWWIGDGRNRIKRTQHNNRNGKDKQNVLAVFCASTIPTNAIQAILSVFKAFCVESE